MLIGDVFGLYTSSLRASGPSVGGVGTVGAFRASPLLNSLSLSSSAKHMGIEKVCQAGRALWGARFTLTWEKLSKP